MALKVKDLAIVLRSVAYGERDRVVTAITENHGFVSALAKNAVHSRRFGGALQPFTASDWIFEIKPTGDLALLHEATTKKSFETLGGNLEIYSAAAVATEVLLRVSTSGTRSDELFRLHSNFLVALEEWLSLDVKAVEDPVFFVNAYLLKLLQWAGHAPQMKACLKCAKSQGDLEEAETAFSSVELAGWVCEKCLTANSDRWRTWTNLSPFHLSSVLMMESLPVRKLAESFNSFGERKKNFMEAQKSLFQFLEGMLVFHLPAFDRSPIKSLKFLGLQSNLLPK